MPTNAGGARTVIADRWVFRSAPGDLNPAFWVLLSAIFRGFSLGLYQQQP